MWKTNLSTFDSWSFRWESTQELWFVLVEEDELPFLCLRSGVNQASVGKVPFTTMTERRSRAMGRASFNARFNITDVICAPSFTCFTAADNFIKGFQDGLEDEMKILNIKVDGGLSSTVEGYYLCKQFQSMLVESGFNVDESYETSVKCPENYKIDPIHKLRNREEIPGCSKDKEGCAM
ncbi:Ubiquitin-associated and SH3 domain-containing protein [Trichinella pseudospiralis]